MKLPIVKLVEVKKMTEVSKIKEDFNKVITYSQGIGEPKTDKLFDIWFKAKRDLIKVFGNKFIY